MHNLKSAIATVKLKMLWVLGASGLLCFGAELQSPAWRRPRSELRIFTFPAVRQAHSLRLDLPVDCRDYADAEALGPDGPLPRRLIHAGEKLIGVEISLSTEVLNRLPFSYELQGAIQVYLFQNPLPQAEKKVEKTPKPLSMQHGQERITARPGTCRDYLRYSRKHQFLVSGGALPRFPDAESTGQLTSLLTAKHKLRIRLSAMLRRASAAKLQFAIRNPKSGPWYLFVENAPVFSWGETEIARSPNQPNSREAGLRVSRPVSCPQGLSRLDLCAFLEPGEEFPQLLYRELHTAGGFRPLDPASLYSPQSALALIVERRNDVLSPGLRLEPLAAIYAFRGTQSILGLVRVYDLSRQWFKQPILTRTLRVDGLEQEFNERPRLEMLFPGPGANELELVVTGRLGSRQKLKAGFRLDWAKARSTRVQLRLRDLPWLEPVDEPYRFGYDLDLKELPARLKNTFEKHARLALRWYDGDSRLVRQRRWAIPRSPFRHTVELLRPEARVKRLELSLELRQLPLCPPTSIYLVRPEDPAAFGPGGRQLRYRDGFAVLRRPGTLKAAGAEQVENAGWKGAAAGPGLRKVIIVDDFIANRGHVRGGFQLADWPWRVNNRALKVTHLPLAAGALAKAHPVLAKYHALARVLQAKPDLVLWAVGMQDAKAGVDLRDYRSQLLFLVNACRRRKLPVILVALPPDGRLPRAKMRAYALLVKELGAECKVPVADLYSASRQRGGIAEFWQLGKNSGGLRSAVPNAAGRRWFCQELNRALNGAAHSGHRRDK